MSRLPKFNDLKFTKKPSTRAPQYAKEDARRTVEVADLVAQRNRAVTDLASVKAELHRWQHGHQVEGDYVCPLMPDLDEANIVIERGAVALRAAQARIEELEAALRTSAELVGSFEAGIRLTQEVHSRTLAVALETMHAALGKVKP